MSSRPLSLMAVVAVIAAWPSLAQQPIRIGASIAISGRDAVQGSYVREGYLLCQKHENEKGGVLGRPMEFVIRDDGSDPKAAAALYEKLITEDKADAVIGPYGSAMTDAAADITEKHRKLMVAPAAGTTSLWEKGRRYLVMVTSPLEAATEGTIDLAARHGLKTIALINADTLTGKAVAKGTLELAKNKGPGGGLSRDLSGGHNRFLRHSQQGQGSQPRCPRGKLRPGRGHRDNPPNEGNGRERQNAQRGIS
jgi:branched-chain amino acid transport system substrate-binding protein